MTTETLLTNGDQVQVETEESAPSTPQPDNDLNNALKLSRQFMILLEDYRYLMSCYQETCGCHVNFDHQIFFHKLEEKYNILANISANNAFLADALDDNSDYTTLNDLWVDMKKDSSNLKREPNDPPPQFIKRIKISGRRYSSNHNGINNENCSGRDDASNPEVTSDHSDLLKAEMVAYRCTHAKCDFLTFNQDDIMKHFNNHGMYESTKRFDKNAVLYVCDQCSKEFSAQKWLDNHVENVHANIKIYSCDQPNCHYKSKFRCVMDDHKKRHGANREFKCTWEGCGSEFVTKRDMLAHINFSHKGIKNYACTWPNCSASFKDSNRLRHHLFTHTGERPYSCDYPGCQASFKQMPHLHKHRKTHVNENARMLASMSNNPCVCPVDDCNTQFNCEDELNQHVSRMHPGVTQLYRCETEGCNLYFELEEQHHKHLKEDHKIFIE